MTSKRKLFVTLLATTVAAGFALIDNASAASKKKKVTFEQAWKLCKAELDDAKIPTTTGSNMNERYIRGGSCMMKYGYKL